MVVGLGAAEVGPALVAEVVASLHAPGIYNLNKVCDQSCTC